jgi:hypothetical protein
MSSLKICGYDSAASALTPTFKRDVLFLYEAGNHEWKSKSVMSLRTND